VGITAVVVLVLLVAGWIVLAPGRHGGSGVAVVMVRGVPVGVKDTRAGALAAADNYLAVASQSIEQDPGEFAGLVAEVYAPQERASTLADAARIRAGDPRNMTNYQEGGRGLAVIAAQRLARYTPQHATVTSWLGGFVWGPHLAPRQTWNLIDTTLSWQSGRWLVESSDTEAMPAPVPSIVYVEGDNDQSAAFARLAGMSAPFYGSGG
jgi:hypothetical protein